MYDAFERGDFDTALAHFHPDVKWDEPPDNPDARTRHGRKGVERALTTWMGAFEDYRYELRELTACGDDMVLLGAWQSGRGKASGVRVSEENFCLFTLRDGQIVRQQMFRRRAEALGAVGLRE